MKTVFVGLSGGVDSAVAAYLLKEEGYNVVGVFIKGWEPDFLPCTGTEDRLSAMRVAAHLGIPFKTYDLEEEYKQSVVDYFVDEYKAGRTPNPDVMCNRTIKFGAMWKRAHAEGADFIATGHYARVSEGRGSHTDSSERTMGASSAYVQNKVTGDRLQMAVSEDKEKDQTYFLWTLTQDDLEHTLFPIGKYKKSEVRKIAERAKLPNALRRDSQGLCFLGHVDMHSFLKRYLPTKPGDIIYDNGDKKEKVGEHDGAWFYTLGQHVTVSAKERMYVVSKDIDANTLTVSNRLKPEGGRTSLKLANTSWVEGKAPEGEVLAQYRYHGPMVEAALKGDTVTLAEPVLVAPGQSLVFYKDDICLGGGVVR